MDTSRLLTFVSDPSCLFAIGSERILMKVGNGEWANKLLWQAGSEIARDLVACGLSEAVIDWEGRESTRNPFRVLASMADADMPHSNSPPSSRPSRRDLQNANYPKVLDFLMESRADDWCVVIAALTPSMEVIHANDLLPRARILTAPAQLLAVNNPYLWRDSLDIHAELEQLLRREKFVPEFYYWHYRTDDSAAKFMHSFYFVEDFCGLPVRIALSRPSDWEVLSTPVAARA